MAQCNDCKIELEKPDEAHQARCPQCGKFWNLTDDNLAIKSSGTIKVNNMKVNLTPKLKFIMATRGKEQ